MDSVQIKSFAKINLSLLVKGFETGVQTKSQAAIVGGALQECAVSQETIKKKHLLDSVAMSIDLYDMIQIAPRTDERVEVVFENFEIAPHKNTVKICLEKFVKRFGLCGFDICIKKQIPEMSGLGGSSANLASILCLLAKQYGIQYHSHTQEYKRGNMPSKYYMRMTHSELADFGSDVPFMMQGGLGRIQGVGDRVDFFACGQKYKVVLARQGIVPTQLCFETYDKFVPIYGEDNGTKEYPNPNNAKVVECLLTGKIGWLKTVAHNALVRSANSINPHIASNIDTLYQGGAVYATMSGSGSACFALLDNDFDTQEVLKKLRQSNDFVYECNTVECGTQIIS
ncbi:MAG: hypothetical protein FWD76_01985 [Firmicutes bacterium]|nr:hypothetical protein [Bacillota bacterium]